MSFFVVARMARPEHTHVSPKDLEALDGMARRSRRHLVPDNGYLSPWKERLMDASFDPARRVWLAWSHLNTIAAFLDGELRWDGMLSLHQLVVDDSHRRQGLGAALVRAAGREYTRLEAHVRTPEAAEFWSGLGWKRISKDTFQSYPDGEAQRSSDPSSRLVRPAAKRELEACLFIRRKVFVEGQGVPEALEVDGLDQTSFHGLGFSGEEAVATARLRVQGPTAKVERVAVLPKARGTGLGRGIMAAMEQEAAARGLAKVRLNAQTAVEPFYRSLGYQAEGEVFWEANIPHRKMTKSLPLGTQFAFI